MRGGSSVGQTGLLLGDSLFSKELENMGKQLAGKQLCGVSGCIYVNLLVALMMDSMGKSDQILSVENKT